jgi:hypothetical protein
MLKILFRVKLETILSHSEHLLFLSQLNNTIVNILVTNILKIR